MSLNNIYFVPFRFIRLSSSLFDSWFFVRTFTTNTGCLSDDTAPRVSSTTTPSSSSRRRLGTRPSSWRDRESADSQPSSSRIRLSEGKRRRSGKNFIRRFPVTLSNSWLQFTEWILTCLTTTSIALDKFAIKETAQPLPMFLEQRLSEF